MINKFINCVKNWLSPPPMAVSIELDWPKRQNIEQVSLDKPIERWRMSYDFRGLSNWH